MNSNSKSYPIFYTVIAVLVLAFLGGTGFAIYKYLELSDAKSAYEKSKNNYTRARNADPSEAEVAVSAENIKILEAKLDSLVKDLSRSSAEIFNLKLDTTEGYQFVGSLGGLVNRWKKDSKDVGIVVAPDIDFGFKRYVQPNAPAPAPEAILPLAKQASILNYILGKLIKSKPAETEMNILSVARENLAEENAGLDMKNKSAMSARQREDKKEIFQIDPKISARIAGSINTLAFKFEFTGHTEVLRLFLNQLRTFDAMLVVRSIEVKPADMNAILMADAGAINGSAPAFDPFAVAVEESTEGVAGTPAVEEKTPIVSNNISQFIVIIEYLEVVKELPKVDKKAEEKSE